jgi:Ca2+-binding EF-hand superfamily protein
MGEPFHVREGGGDTLTDWFNQADKNHDGFLTVDEMQTDAARFFAILDTNHDGEIDPDEIDHYETVIAPEVSSGGHLEMAALDRSQRGGGGGGRGGHGGRGGGGHRDNGSGHKDWQGTGVNQQGYQGAERFGLLDLPEPVISADTNFNRGVSLEEFRQAAAHRFAALDINHQGRLTLAVLETLRPAAPPVEHPSTTDSAPSADQNM